MADPLRTDDFPEFDTYPGLESPETPVSGRTLHSTAQQIGSTMGRAVRAARELPERVDQLRVDLRDRVVVMPGRGPSAVEEKASQLKEAAQRKLEAGKQRAAEMARMARTRARRIADEQPLHVLLGVFAAGLIAGVMLRLWRNRD